MNKRGKYETNSNMRVKRRTKEKGTWTVGVDDETVDVKGRMVTVKDKEGRVKTRKFVGRGELADGTKMKVRDKTRFR